MNKNILLLFFLFIGIGSLSAQSFKIEPLPAYATADLQDANTSPGDVVAHAEITNLTNEDLSLRWKRTEMVMPEGWTSGICDINYCYGIEEGRQDFILPAGSTGRLDVHIYPGGTPGSIANGANPGMSTVLLTVTNLNNTEDTLSGIYYVEVTGDPVISSTVNPEIQEIKLFPNPTSEYFELSNPSGLVDQIAVHNILGRQVDQFNAVEQRFDVAELPQGLYLVSLMDDKENILKTMRLQKR